jgi:cohesin complex subunit SCC1
VFDVLCVVDMGPRLENVFKIMMTTGDLPFTMREEEDKEDEEEDDDEEEKVEMEGVGNKRKSRSAVDDGAEEIEQARAALDASASADLDQIDHDLNGEPSVQDFDLDNQDYNDPSLTDARDDQNIDAEFQADESGIGLDDVPEMGDDLQLNAVNDFRDETSEDVAGKDHKWHPNSIKVMNILDDKFEKQKSLSYKGIAKPGTSRRSAAGCFFELLQLKTWDYIEVEQGKAYGDIKITKAPQFDEKILEIAAASS